MPSCGINGLALLQNDQSAAPRFYKSRNAVKDSNKLNQT